MKIYKLSIIKLFFKSIFVWLLLLITAILFNTSVTILYYIFTADPKAKYFSLIVVGIYFYIYYISFQVIKLFFQYFLNAKGKKIILDYKNQKIILVVNDNETVFDRNNLLVIENNLSAKSSQNLTSGYEFIKLITVDKEYVVSNFLIEGDDFLNILPEVKRIIKFNNINYLK